MGALAGRVCECLAQAEGLSCSSSGRGQCPDVHHHQEQKRKRVEVRPKERRLLPRVPVFWRAKARFYV